MKDYGYLEKRGPSPSYWWWIIIALVAIFYPMVLYPNRTEQTPTLNREDYRHIISELREESNAQRDSIMTLIKNCRRLR